MQMRRGAGGAILDMACIEPPGVRPASGGLGTAQCAEAVWAPLAFLAFRRLAYERFSAGSADEAQRSQFPSWKLRPLVEGARRE